jgi:outer membrane protein
MPTFKNLLLFSLLSALALILFFSQSPALAQTSFTVGVVDIRKAIGDSKQGKAASNKLETRYNSLKKGLDAKQANLEKKDADLRKQAPTLSQEALEKRSQELMAEVAAFREEAQKATEEMQKAFEDAMAPISKQAEQVTSEIAKERRFSMVLDASTGVVLFVDQSYDITSEVTQRMDKLK